MEEQRWGSQTVRIFITTNANVQKAYNLTLATRREKYRKRAGIARET